MIIKSKSFLFVFYLFLIGTATFVQAVTPKCPNCGRSYQKYSQMHGAWNYKPACNCSQSKVSSGAGSGLGSSEQMALDLIQSMLQGALNPPKNPGVSAVAYKARQEAIAKKKAQEALEERQRKQKATKVELDKKKKKDMDALAGIFGGGEIANDSSDLSGIFGVPVVELKPRGTANRDTSALSEIDRLRCATYFSNKATEASAKGDHVNAKYMHEQAQKAMSGQVVDEEVQLADLRDIPEVPAPQPTQPATNKKKLAEYERLIKVVEQDRKKLHDIAVKLKGAGDDKEMYANEKEKITKRLKEMQKSVQNLAESD